MNKKLFSLKNKLGLDKLRWMADIFPEQIKSKYDGILKYCQDEVVKLRKEIGQAIKSWNSYEWRKFV